MRFPETQLLPTRNYSISFGGGLPLDAWGGTVRNSYYTEAPSAMLRLRSGDLEINLIGSACRQGIPFVGLRYDFLTGEGEGQ